MKQFFSRHLYPGLLTLLVTQGVVLLLCTLFEFTLPIYVTLPILLVLTALVHMFSYYKKTPLFLLFIPLMMFILMIISRYNPDFFTTFGSDLSKWWNSDLRDTTLPPYFLLILFPATFLMTLVIYHILQIYYCRAAIAVIILVLLVVFTMIQHKPGKEETVFLLTFISLLVVETSLRYSIRKNRLTETSYVVHFWPVFALIMLLLFSFPYKKTPIEWKLVTTIWNRVTASIDNIITAINLSRNINVGEFGISFVGYSGDGDLGGYTEAVMEEVIQVKQHQPTTDSIYLIGNTKNIYTGHSWEEDIIRPENLMEYDDLTLDMVELMYATLRMGYRTDHANLYLYNNYTLEFLDYKSRTMFYPSKAYRFTLIEPSELSYEAEGSSLLFPKLQRRGTTYQTYLNRVNYGSNEFHQFVNEAAYTYGGTTLELTDREKAGMFSLPTTSLLVTDTDTVLKSYADMIKANYLSLPDDLPERVYTLAQDLTSAHDKPYDKLLALENYLQQFTYTTRPEQASSGQDFVDFLLFDSKEGYCTYFASAMAVLGRCIGIPTRYVQGYHIPESDSSIRSVYSSNAHAWAEAYLEGIGWVILEATPGYSSGLYQPWHIVKRDSDDIILATMTPTPTPDFAPIEVPAKPKSPYTAMLPGLWLLPSVFLIIIGFYLFMKYVRMKHDYRQAGIEQQFYYEFKQIISITGYFSLTPFTGETITAFYHRFIEQYPDYTESWTQLCEYFEEYRYGNHTVTTDACNHARALRQKLLSLLKEEKGKRILISYRINEIIHYHKA